MVDLWVSHWGTRILMFGKAAFVLAKTVENDVASLVAVLLKLVLQDIDESV